MSRYSRTSLQIWMSDKLRDINIKEWVTTSMIQTEVEMTMWNQNLERVEKMNNWLKKDPKFLFSEQKRHVFFGQENTFDDEVCKEGWAYSQINVTNCTTQGHYITWNFKIDGHDFPYKIIKILRLYEWKISAKHRVNQIVGPYDNVQDVHAKEGSVWNTNRDGAFPQQKKTNCTVSQDMSLHALLQSLQNSSTLEAHNTFTTLDTKRWVCVDFRGNKNITCERPEKCDCAVVDFLRAMCENYYIDLRTCTVDLNGHAYEMSSGKKIGDLANAVGCNDPMFVIRN
jgi:hypothetical protein